MSGPGEGPSAGFTQAHGVAPRFKGELTMDEVGYIQTKLGTIATNIPSGFACGDVAVDLFTEKGGGTLVRAQASEPPA